ncbi:hypothetical protein BDR07DRAFT_1424360 [Suillus spraguei]|nr:hypothetical protein BDR07DRAFT_1424360 [Suillus spraguei]
MPQATQPLMDLKVAMYDESWEKLSHVSVKGAEHDSPERQPHPKRLEGSWVDLTNCVHALLDDRKKSRLIWLHGAPGVGKSAVAFNIAERMKGLNMVENVGIGKRLAGSFVFSRKHTKRSTTGYFFATLAYQLGCTYFTIRQDMAICARENPALLDPGKSLRNQMEGFFLHPLRMLQYRLRGCPPMVFVIDALHECTSKAELADLISLLGLLLRQPDLPVIHILLASNTQTHIREALRKANVGPLLCEIRASTSGKILAMDLASSCVTEDLPHVLAADVASPCVTEDLPHNPAMDIMLTINTEPRNACLTGDLPTAERLLTQEIEGINVNNHQSYANRSFVMARKHDWDHALQDALESISLCPSLTGYISKGIALCGKNQIQDAIRAFDAASVFTKSGSETTVLLLIKAVALFNANQHEDAMLLVQETITVCPQTDTIACRVVEAYLCVHLGTNALDSGHYSEAADRFTTAVEANAFTSQLAVYSKYQNFAVLFGWDLKSLWENANKKKCDALLRAGRLGDAVESYRYMMDVSDETMKARCLEWSTAFLRECNALYADDGVDELAAYDSFCFTIAHAHLRHTQVIELNPAGYLGYQLKHEALHGAQCYDEAIEAFQIMLLKLDEAPDPQIQRLYQTYISPFEAESAIRKVLNAHFDDAPLRLINTSNGRLCGREAQIDAFKTSAEYKELLASILRNSDLQLEHIKDVVATYFRWVMLSHRWGEKEPLLHDIRDQVVYELDPVDSITKLQSFCEITRDAGFLWAWVDTCCIDQTNNFELQKSVNSMFVWYHNSALTIVYLSDVLPLSKSRTLANSAWIERGWTVQEFLAPKIVRFYRQDWTPYLDDQSTNHKESMAIMQELGDASGIDLQSLVAFHPGMRDSREKLRWASTRITMLQEDIAYSLFGIFGVYLPILYGENKRNALGRLLQEIVAQSGDVSVLDWVGKSSEFNSCLPADITSYRTPSLLPSLSEDDIQTSVSSLREAVVVEITSRLRRELGSLSAARFAHRRLHLPCIAFLVTEVRKSPSQNEEAIFTYQVKAEGLRDLLITTEDMLVQFSPERPVPQTFYFVRPWNRDFLELPDFAEMHSHAGSPLSLDALQSIEDCRTPPESPLHEILPVPRTVDLQSNSQALRLITCLERPFSALLLAQQRGGEYKRIASDHVIAAQVKDIVSVCDIDVRTLEIL